MIKKTAVYIMIALLATVLGGMSCKTGEIDLSACRPLVTEADSGKEIQMKAGDTICVKLRAQLGTGFGWYVEKSSSLLKQLGNPMQMQEKKGEPGSVEFAGIPVHRPGERQGRAGTLLQAPLDEERPAGKDLQGDSDNPVRMMVFTPKRAPRGGALFFGDGFCGFYDLYGVQVGLWRSLGGIPQ